MAPTAGLGATPAPPPGVALDRLAAYLRKATPGLFGGPLQAELIPGGRSNLTYVVTDGTREVVLRRPPLGHVLATAHDMSREFRVISALAGTPVPVPPTIHLCSDAEVIGAPFYLMERMPGLALRGELAHSALTHDQQAKVTDRLVDVLADLHAVDPAAIGLADFGRPEGYLQRQVSRWRRQLESSRSRDVPGFDELHDRLAAAVPESSRATIVHGDYRLDNVLVTVDSGEPQISAVLDWEMATLGDPLADVGLLLVYWDGLGSVDNTITGRVGGIGGYPTGDALRRRYADRSGLDLSSLDWYVGFGFYKLAVIIEGIHYRYVQGQTVGAGFDEIGALVAPIVALGLEAVSAVPSG